MGICPYEVQCHLNVVVGGAAAAEMDPELNTGDPLSLVDTLEKLGLRSPTDRLGVQMLSIPANMLFVMPQHGPHGGAGTMGEITAKVSKRLFFLCRPAGEGLTREDDSAVDPSEHVRACIGPSVRWTHDNVEEAGLARGIAITLGMQALQHAPQGPTQKKTKTSVTERT